MNTTDLSNMRAAFKQPRVPVQKIDAMKQTSSFTNNSPAASPMDDFHRRFPASAPIAPASSTKPVEKGFQLVNFSGNKVVKNDSLFQKNFRYNTRKALEGTLKRFADRKTVADLLWNRRGSGLNVGEVKAGLRKLEASKKLSYDQVKAVRRKIGLY